MNAMKKTFEKIQKEIQESIDREKELKNCYSSLNGNGVSSSTKKEISSTLVNGISKLNLNQDKDVVKHGSSSISEINRNNYKVTPSKEVIPVSNGGVRRFVPNSNTKGVMQKFLKNRGKVTSSINSPIQQNGFSPVKFRVQKGQTPRNGYVSTEQKIVKELEDFQIRESELRSERMKSQPDLMAALELDDRQINSNSGLKSARSLTNLYQTEDISKHSF